MRINSSCLLLCMLLILSSITVITSSYEAEIHQESDGVSVNPCDCEQRNRKYSTQSRLLNPVTIDESFEASLKPTIRNDLPPYFNWMDRDGVDRTTPAKDQGNCGSCWLCAGLGTLESVIQIREGCAELNLDLSEQYVLSCLPAAGSCQGGWAYRGFKYIMSNSSLGNYCNGIIPEFCFPYEANDSIPCSDTCPDWEDFLIPISNYGYWNPDGSGTDRDAIKTQMMEDGPVVTAMYCTYYPHGPDNLEEWGWTHHNPDDYYPFIESSRTNHQVVLVGWKDDPEIPNGGYWIVKNSFSQEWGYDGFFNIAYGSLNIDSAYIDWVDYNPENYSNWKPVANANGSYQSDPGVTIEFNASKSIDHEGEINSYSWDLGDGTQTSGVSITHTYSEVGVYPIVLTVTDNDEYTDEDTTWAFIGTENHPPDTPRLWGRRTGEKDSIYRVMFRANDPDGDDVYYYLNWGDTFWEGWWEGWIGPYQSGEWVTLENTWEENGNYTVRVKAKDIYGAKSDFATLQVSVPQSVSIKTAFLNRLIEKNPILSLIL